MVEYLPDNIIYIVKNYMWGDKIDWINEFNKSINRYSGQYEDEALYKLKVCKWQKRSNNIEYIEDNLYCPVCGEKTLDFALSFLPRSNSECICN